jgi:hypothetical protein
LTQTQLQPRPAGLPIIQVVKDAVPHFESRITEWAMAGALTLWGLNLLDPAVNFDVALPAWRGMTAIPFLHDAKSWGWFAFSIGLVRLVSLVVNGRFAGTRYATVSPRVRAFTAMAGATAWFVVAASVGQVPTPGRVTYILPLLLDIWCVFHAARDTGRVQAKAKQDAQL